MDVSENVSDGPVDSGGKCVKSEEIFEKYDPQMSRSQSLLQQQQQQQELQEQQLQQQQQNNDIEAVILYEKIGKTQIHPKLSDVKTSDETSGSGNSDTSGGIYTRVKKVPKAEEIAYAVVDIKDSQNKYEMVNGDLVRKVALQNQDDDVPIAVAVAEVAVASAEESAATAEEIENETRTSEVMTVNLQEISHKDSVEIDLYASVIKKNSESEKSTSKTEPAEPLESTQTEQPEFIDSTQINPQNQCNEQPSIPKEDEYAVVNKPKKGTSEANETKQEDSRNSGLYEAVDSKVAPKTPPTKEPSTQTETNESQQEDSSDYDIYDAVNDDVITDSSSRKGSSACIETNKNHEKDPMDSDIYEAVIDKVTTKTPPIPPPIPLSHPSLPPVHLSNIQKYNSFDDRLADHQSGDDEVYEEIGNSAKFDSLERDNTSVESLEHDNTYDCISDSFKVNMKKEKRRKHSKELVDGVANNKKHAKQEQYKMKHSKSMRESRAPNSPKTSSRLFRGNPFKSSKKHRKSIENLYVESITIGEKTIDQDEVDEEFGKSQMKSSPQTDLDKVRSLPMSRKSPLVSDDKRYSVPPPLPSVDKLMILSGHNHIKNRAASFDACSSPGE